MTYAQQSKGYEQNDKYSVIIFQKIIKELYAFESTNTKTVMMDIVSYIEYI